MIGKSSKAFRECKNDPRQMASSACVPNTMAMVELEAKKKYKTKKKEKDVVVENMITLGQTMIGEQFHDEETQSIRCQGHEKPRK